MYLGEITRNILVALIDAAPKPVLFSGKATPVLNKHYGLDTSVMSEVEGAWEGNDDTDIGKDYGVPAFGTFDADKLSAALRARLERVRVVVAKQLGFKDVEVSLRDAAVCRPEFRRFVRGVYPSVQVVRWACSLVARRAALLSGVAVAATLIQTGRASLADADGQHTPQTITEKIWVGVDGRFVIITLLSSHHCNNHPSA